MAANQTSVGGMSFSTIVDRIIARIVAGVTGATATNTRLVVAPSAEKIGPEYLGQPGILVRVDPPEPFAESGAGRHGYIVERTVDVVIITASLLDVGGRDDAALRAHLLKEEQVVNVLCLDPPADLAYGTPTGRLIKFVRGGADITRRLPTTPSLVASALRFNVTYNAPLVVYRD